MVSRRDFLKQVALLAASGTAMPESISRALAIDPAPGSTFLDAEHVVILMQENRSFDHCYGALRGVRGFNDPRAVELPGGNPVWLQTNATGETYAPFRLNLRGTNATWQGCLPHSWGDQSRARGEGRHDRWLHEKASGNHRYAAQPLTLGYYDRDDLPFYYALADAFTVCDQNFCSTLTGTTPNRLHLWSGKIRATDDPAGKACVSNSDADLGTMVSWKTLPERLEEAGVSWGTYQNELTVASGLSDASDDWLANFGDNPLEYFTQFAVRGAPQHQRHMAELAKSLPDEIARLEAAPKPWSDALAKKIRSRRAQLAEAQRDLAQFAALSPAQQSLHRKAFVTNEGDPHFRELEEISYDDNGTTRRMHVPKGDLFHQFRADVQAGKLPTVSWLVAPRAFSDHPDSPWYGAWYVSETLDILTSNPDVWRKTIFILCYDENDGYFDHVPPFVPPHPDQPGTGKASASIGDLALEHASVGATAGPMGLGYRVPLVIASPWSRGGYVCSQVFDHTSIVQLVEKIASRRSGREIRETNISPWRRTICGDLTSAFRPWNGEKIDLPKPVERTPMLESIHRAQFQPLPGGFRKLEPTDLALARTEPAKCAWLPRQENGTRPACALPYELSADGALSADRKSIVLRFSAGRELFGESAAGAPFHVYSPKLPRTRAYAVAPGDHLEDAWPLADFPDRYDVRVHGPNGFFRNFRGIADDPALDVALLPGHSGDAVLRLANRDPHRALTIRVEDASYGAAPRTIDLAAGQRTELSIALRASHGWHDLRVRVDDAPRFERRLAGRIETGRESISDPAMSGSTTG